MSEGAQAGVVSSERSSEAVTRLERKRPSHAGAAGRRAPTFHAIGFGRRLLAAFVDALIVFPISLILTWIVGKIGGFGLPPSLGPDYWLDLLLTTDPSMIALVVMLFAVGSIYLFVFQATLGRTVGMRVVRSKVIDVYGDPLNTARSALRTLGVVAGFATLGLGFLWIGFDSEKRGLQDWIASTYVVRAG